MSWNLVLKIVWEPCLLLIKENLLFFKGSVYFTAKMLVATDWLELLCRQLNIQSRGMTQFE